MRRAFTGLVLVAFSYVLLPVTAAEAAPAYPGAVQRSLTATSTSPPSATPTAAAASTITCTITADNPHKSTHVPGTVNVVGHTDCTAPVASISMTVYLYNYDTSRLVGVNGPTGNSGRSSFALNAAASCISGRYYGYARTTINFPPGYSPSPQSAASYSSIILVNC